MEGESKNWWPANYSKPEIWPLEPEWLRTSAPGETFPILHFQFPEKI